MAKGKKDWEILFCEGCYNAETWRSLIRGEMFGCFAALTWYYSSQTQKLAHTPHNGNLFAEIYSCRMDTTIDQFYEVHKNYLKNHFIPYPIDRKFDSIKDACSTTLYVLQQELFLEEKMKLNTKSKNSIILRKKKTE